MPPWGWVEVASDLWMRDPGLSEPRWGDVQGTHSPVHLPAPTPGCSASLSQGVQAALRLPSG